jgi:hypothetical protein
MSAGSSREWPTLIYICPECGSIKDARDEERHFKPHGRHGRWCHAYQAHNGGKRRMEPIMVRPAAIADIYTKFEERTCP